MAARVPGRMKYAQGNTWLTFQYQDLIVLEHLIHLNVRERSGCQLVCQDANIAAGIAEVLLECIDA